MQLQDIAIKNLQRRKSKMLFLVFGMVFGIATIVTLFTLTNAMETSINRKIQDTGIKLAVVPKSDTASFSVGGIPIISEVSFNVKYLSPQAVNKISSVTDADKIKVIAPKVMGTILVNGKKVLLVGVDFPSEFKLKSWWEVDGKRPEQANQALIGSKVADKLKITLGQTIISNGKALVVAGILKENGEDEDGIIFVDLKTAQSLLGENNNLSFVELTTVKDNVVTANISKEIALKLPDARVSIVKEAEEARQELVDKFSKFSLVVSLVMILIAALIITTTMMASVNERIREIGIFRAIGFRKAHITKIILIEAGIVCGISALTGYLLGMVTAIIIAPLFAGFKLVISWNILLGIAVLASAILLGILASLYPAAKAAKLDPAEALRFI
ncbi:MAG: ABC transporter permease [Carboxydocellales bacterium]